MGPSSHSPVVSVSTGWNAEVRREGASLELPRAEDFVEHPASWYPFCRSRELSRGPVGRRMLDKDLVAWRTSAGRVVVMSARCAHLGADLARGTLAGDRIRCPFHGWEYGADGACERAPGCDAVPARAQRVYPAVERHGLVFFFNGAQPLFPLPFFDGERAEDMRAGTPVTFEAECSWSMVTAHAFDLQHFESVHSRHLTGPLVVDEPAAFARRSRYSAEVLGDAWYDRLLRRLAGKEVDISITVFGGTLVLITGDFARARSRFLIATEPLDRSRSRCHIVVFARAGANLLQRFMLPLDLWIRRLFTRAYLVHETNGLGSPSYSPKSLVEADRELIDFFRWAATLP